MQVVDHRKVELGGLHSVLLHCCMVKVVAESGCRRFFVMVQTKVKVNRLLLLPNFSTPLFALLVKTHPKIFAGSACCTAASCTGIVKYYLPEDRAVNLTPAADFGLISHLRWGPSVGRV